jgi:peptidoglycan DL-endopeptidase LytF
MNRKNIIIISAVANAALLLILFVSAVVSREDKKNPSSVEMASSILEKNPDGMVLLPQETENALAQKKESKPFSQAPLPVTTTPASSNELVPLQPLGEVTEVTSAPQAESQVVHKLPDAVLQEKASDIVFVNPSETSKETSAQEKKEAFIEVVVKKGDSLDKLARRYHCSIREIKKENNLEGSFLKVGKSLRIPTKEVSEKSSSKRDLSNESPEFYVIKHGDNPWTVAVKHHLKVEELLRLNHMSKEKAKKLRPGDKLRIR